MRQILASVSLLALFHALAETETGTDVHLISELAPISEIAERLARATGHKVKGGLTPEEFKAIEHSDNIPLKEFWIGMQ